MNWLSFGIFITELTEQLQRKLPDLPADEDNLYNTGGIFDALACIHRALGYAPPLRKMNRWSDDKDSVKAFFDWLHSTVCMLINLNVRLLDNEYPALSGIICEQYRYDFLFPIENKIASSYRPVHLKRINRLLAAVYNLDLDHWIYVGDAPSAVDYYNSPGSIIDWQQFGGFLKSLEKCERMLYPFLFDDIQRTLSSGARHV